MALADIATLGLYNAATARPNPRKSGTSRRRVQWMANNDSTRGLRRTGVVAGPDRETILNKTGSAVRCRCGRPHNIRSAKHATRSNSHFLRLPCDRLDGRSKAGGEFPVARRARQSEGGSAHCLKVRCSSPEWRSRSAVLSAMPCAQPSAHGNLKVIACSAPLYHLATQVSCLGTARKYASQHNDRTTPHRPNLSCVDLAGEANDTLTHHQASPRALG